ncbi:CgeB family protein [Spirosoma fluviale]|uniref:Spore maturation protein CgeB n=1 Tax=Spirosoma fluviale TaxID=1597977 RepID=A0A286G3W7_9BACT|nr:glycosyltransferase [Spirosoma fluviale]SOD90182.1 spore maturation protein CgeB [Spirosoma fluviale]
MKIAIIGSQAFDSFEYNLCDSFRTLGHEVSIVDIADVLPVSVRLNYWVSRFIESYDRVVSVRLANKVALLRPDLVLVVYRNLHPMIVRQIKEHCPGPLVVQINPDALSNLEKQQIIAADFDHYFSKEPFVVDFLTTKIGANAHYLPEGFNPRIHKKPAIEKTIAEWLTEIDVLVFGNLYAYRARMIEHLMRAGIKVAVYGTEGPYMRPVVRSAFRKQYLVGPDKNRLLYGAKIVFNNFHYAEITSVNQKYFEINGIGAFQLSDYKPTIEEYTGVPADLVTYRSVDEAIDKIRHYLVHASERHELADRQYVHFQQHHTLDLRVGELLHTVGLPAAPVSAVV